MGGGEVIKKGWLVKSPPLENSGIKSWRKRWFTLRSSKVLEYYKNESSSDLKGVINLEDCISVHSSLFHRKYKHVFDIQTKERTYYLVASSSDEMDLWVKTICDVCGFYATDNQKDSNTGTTKRYSVTLPSNIQAMPLPAPPTTTDSPHPQHRVISMEGMDGGEGGTDKTNNNKAKVPSGVSLTQALAAKGFKTGGKGFGGGGGGGMGRSSRSASIVSSSSVSRESVTLDYCTPRPQDKPSYLETIGFQTYDTPTGTSGKFPDWYDVPHSWTDPSHLAAKEYLPNGYMHMQTQLDGKSPNHHGRSGENWATPPESNYDVPPPPRLAYPNNIYDVPPPPRLANPEDTYDVPPPPRPLTDDTYDVPPPPRPLTDDTYDVPPPPRPLTDDTYDVPPPPRPLTDDTYDVPPPPRPLTDDTYDVPPPPRPLTDDTYDVPRPTNPPTHDDTYDYPPPPRPAYGNYDSLSPIESTDSSKVCPETKPEPHPHGLPPSPEQNSHNYVNIRTVMSAIETPPIIDRNNKPTPPPKVDRSTKPKGESTIRHSDGGSPLMYEFDPSSRPYSTSSSSTISDVTNEEPFSPTRDVPRLTRNSIRYCHVTFLRKPVPVPRTKIPVGSSPVPACKYQYSDVDLLATASYKESNSSNSSYSDSGISSNDPNSREKNEIFDNFSGSFEETAQDSSLQQLTLDVTS